MLAHFIRRNRESQAMVLSIAIEDQLPSLNELSVRSQLNMDMLAIERVSRDECFEHDFVMECDRTGRIDALQNEISQRLLIAERYHVNGQPRETGSNLL